MEGARDEEPQPCGGDNVSAPEKSHGMTEDVLKLVFENVPKEVEESSSMTVAPVLHGELFPSSYSLL